jgi:hypothetical protein
MHTSERGNRFQLMDGNGQLGLSFDFNPECEMIATQDRAASDDVEGIELHVHGELH